MGRGQGGMGGGQQGPEQRGHGWETPPPPSWQKARAVWLGEALEGAFRPGPGVTRRQTQTEPPRVVVRGRASPAQTRP